MRSVVQLYPGPPEISLGAVAQLGERLVCNQEATGSIPVSSTRFRRKSAGGRERLKSLLVDAGIAIFLVLAFGDRVFGLAEFPIRLRVVRFVFGMIALLLILTGAYWK